MALTLTVNPNTTQLSRNPVWAKLTTNNYQTTAGTKASLRLEVTGTGATATQTITIPFNGITVVMTFFVGSVNGSGIQLRTAGALSLANFILQLAADFATNYHIADAYDITTDATAVIFTAKQAGTAYNFISPSDTTTDLAIGTNTVGVDEVLREDFRIALDVYLEETYASGTYTKVHSKQQIPVSNACLFNIADALHRYMGTDKPTYGLAAITLCTGILRRYKIRYAEKYSSVTDEYMGVTESSVCYVLKGGISFIEERYAPTFLTGYITSNQKFLTWQPRTKTVVQSQPEYLNFFVPSSTTTIKLKAKLYYTDNTTLTVTALTKTPTVQNELYILPVGYTEIIAPSATKTVSKYQVWVENQSDVVKSEVFTYKLTAKTEIDQHLFLFESSLGAWETLRTSGEQVKAVAIETQIAQRQNEILTYTSLGEFEKFDATGTSTFTQSTGFKTKEDIDWLEDLLYSKNVVEVIGGEHLPVIINTAGITKYKTRDNLYAFTFEYAYAFNNKAPKGGVPM